MQARDVKSIRSALNRISGQVRGVSQMVEDGRYCIDILYQVHAARAALAVNAESRTNVFPISAVTGEGLAPLLVAIGQAFDEEKSERSLTLAFSEGRKRAWLHQEGVVQSETETEDGHQITVRWTARQERRYREL